MCMCICSFVCVLCVYLCVCRLGLGCSRYMAMELSIHVYGGLGVVVIWRWNCLYMSMVAWMSCLGMRECMCLIVHILASRELAGICLCIYIYIYIHIYI